MKTWGEIKDEALGLMFANNSGGVKVTTKDASVQEYVINMAAAANYAIRDLSGVVPILRYFTYNQKGTDADGVMRLDMRDMVDDFRAFAPSSDDMLLAGIKTASSYLIIPKRGEIAAEVPYYAYAQTIDAETPDDQDIGMDPVCEDLIPLYMASRLYTEDDVQLATMYRNQYEARRAELMQTADYGDGGGFVNTTGWY